MPQRLGAAGEKIDYFVDGARLDALFERARVDAALAQREVVGEHADLPAEDAVEPGVAGAGPRGHHAVLDEEEGHLTPLAQLAGKRVEVPDIPRLPWALGLDQDVSAHSRPPFCRSW